MIQELWYILRRGVLFISPPGRLAYWSCSPTPFRRTHFAPRYTRRASVIQRDCHNQTVRGKQLAESATPVEYEIVGHFGDSLGGSACCGCCLLYCHARRLERKFLSSWGPKQASYEVDCTRRHTICLVRSIRCHLSPCREPEERNSSQLST